MTSTLCLNISSCKRLLPDQSTHNNPPSNIQQFPFINMQSENFLVCWTHCHNLYFLFVNLSQCKILDTFKTPINKHDFLIGLQISSRLLYRSVYSIFTTHCWYQQCLWEFCETPAYRELQLNMLVLYGDLDLQLLPSYHVAGKPNRKELFLFSQIEF